MKYTFKNGATVEGTVDQVLAIAKSLGMEIEGKFYHSEHSGWIKISEMTTNHLRNALLKRAKKYYEEFDKDLTHHEFLKKFVSIGDDKIVTDLFDELSKRGGK